MSRSTWTRQEFCNIAKCASNGDVSTDEIVDALFGVRTRDAVNTMVARIYNALGGNAYRGDYNKNNIVVQTNMIREEFNAVGFSVSGSTIQVTKAGIVRLPKGHKKGPHKTYRKATRNASKNKMFTFAVPKWKEGFNQAKYIKPEIVTSMYNDIPGNSHIQVQTAKRYFGGGSKYENGPPKAFKKFLAGFDQKLSAYWRDSIWW